MSRRRVVLAMLLAAFALAYPSLAGAATDGTRTLTASQSTNLDPAGQQVTVTGSGYDTFKGIYVAYCVVPPTGQPPSPCGGGIDASGGGGSSHWISSNPPPYGVGVAVPYGPGGSFTVTIHVTPMLNATTDCRQVRCAIVTRNDHTRTSDRSQDLYVPISFAQPSRPAAPGASPTSPSGAPSTPPPPVQADPLLPPTNDTTPDASTPDSAADTTTTTDTSRSVVPDADDDAAGSDVDEIAATRDERTSGSSFWPFVVVGLVVVAIAGAGIGAGLRRRRPGPDADADAT